MSNNTLPFSDVYNNLGICTGLTTLGSYSIPSLSTIYNSVSNPTAPQSLGSGYFSNDIYSANYVQGQNGWKLFYNGNFEGNNGVFRGTLNGNVITAASISGSSITGNTITGGTISGTTITGTSITGNTISGGSITGTTITGGTITGSTFQTETSSTQGIKIYITPHAAHGTGDGFIKIWDSLGDSAVIYMLDTGTLHIDGDDGSFTGIYVNGDVGGNTKSFIIDHPLKADRKLRYVCPESPEVLVMCRGNGDVNLPDHFSAITVENSIQIIKDKDNNNWLATGVRKGFEDFDCESIKK
jgi:hypothetical protein